MANPVGVLLVGRNGIVREGLSRILLDNGFQVLQSVGTLHELSYAAGENVELIVVDPIAWTAEGAEIASTKASFPQARIIALMDKFDFNGVVAALRAGAHGLLLTDISCAGLVQSLQLATKGERILPSQLADMLSSFVADVQWQPDESVQRTNLSTREIEILRCLIMGCPNTLIAKRLGITEAAVKVHVKAVLRKIPVKNRTQAAIWAIKRGITALDLPDVNSAAPVAPAAPVIAATAAQRALEAA